MGTTSDLVHDFSSGKISRRDFVARALALGVSLAGIEAMLQSCGSGGSGAGGKTTVKWSNWANTGELKRFQEFTENYKKTHPQINLQYSFVPSANNNYFAKILTQLNGGVAPDAFYVGDGDVAKLIANRTITELTPLLSGSKSQSKAEDFLPGLWGAAKLRNGKIYGAPVDCNPLVLWINKKVLSDAGVTTMPNELYEKGQWTRDAFQDMINKVQAKGKYGFVLDAWSLQFYVWCTVNGGKVYDNDGYGNFIAHEDPKSLDAFKWLTDNVRKKTIVYAGSLPKGQGSDLAFIGNQTAFVSAGRWYLPEFKTTNGLQYDIVPFPSSTGKIAPAPVALAYMVINKKTKEQDATFEFLTNYVSAQGQTFRLQGGGNAVPSIKATDAEKVVLEGNNPQHAQYFLDARNVGYALFPAEASTPALSDDIKTAMEPVWLQGKDVTTTLAQVANMANPRIKKAQESLQ